VGSNPTLSASSEFRAWLWEGCPEPDPKRLTPFLTPTRTDLCWPHQVDGYGKACLPSEPRTLEGDRDARALMVRLEDLDRRLDAAGVHARERSPRVPWRRPEPPSRPSRRTSTGSWAG
jgi:hypothetical protein